MTISQVIIPHPTRTHTHPFTYVYQVTNLGSAGTYGTTPLGLLSTYVGDLTLKYQVT